MQYDWFQGRKLIQDHILIQTCALDIDDNNIIITYCKKVFRMIIIAMVICCELRFGLEFKKLVVIVYNYHIVVQKNDTHCNLNQLMFCQV